MTKFQQYARDNYKPGSQRDEMWHDAVIAECDVIDAEAIAKREAERARIRAVVEKTADIGAELAGRIVVKVKFDGSHAKKKALTRDETRFESRSRVVERPAQRPAPAAGGYAGPGPRNTIGDSYRRPAAGRRRGGS